MKKQPIKDEKIDSFFDFRVGRSGSWGAGALYSRVSSREQNNASNKLGRDIYVGFRIVRNKDTKEK